MPSTIGSLSAWSLKVHNIQKLIVVKTVGPQYLSPFDLFRKSGEIFAISGKALAFTVSECQKTVILFLLLELLQLELSSKVPSSL